MQHSSETCKTSKKALERYQNLSEKKEKKRKNMVVNEKKTIPEHKKQTLVEYRKKYYEIHNTVKPPKSGHPK